MAKEFGTCEWVTKAQPVLRRNWITAIRAAVTLLLCVAQGSTANADPASCLEKVSSYVAEVDQLLAREKNWIMPFVDLNKRYPSFVDCDTDALLLVTWRSRFLRSINYNPQAKQFIVLFSSDDVTVGFSYYPLTKNSEPPFVGWVNK
jgi:hypothetical protein